MAAINIAPVQQIQAVDLPNEFYETQAQVVSALAIGNTALKIADQILTGSFDLMDNAIIASMISAGQALVNSILVQANNIYTSVFSMIASINSTFPGSATGAAGIILQVNSIQSFLTLINSYISKINNIINKFNQIVSKINLLVSRLQNIKSEVVTTFQQGLIDGVDNYLKEIAEHEVQSEGILKSVSVQMDGLLDTAVNVTNITTDSWRQHIPPYSVDSYNPNNVPGETPDSNHDQQLLEQTERAFRGSIRRAVTGV